MIDRMDSDDDKDLPTLIRRFLLLAEKPITYGALARDLKVEGPGAIAKVTKALEALMQSDMEAGRPFIAALCKSRLSDDMPAIGFFQAATELGRYTGPVSGPEATAFVTQQRMLLSRR